jgi:ribose 5-phosphate isomerase A
MSDAPQDELKKLAGYKAVDDHVRSGMVIGLGTGSTAYFAVERVGQKLKSGELKDIVAIPTSARTEEQAVSLKIPLTTLDEHPELDVSIDGADAVDPHLNLVKGGGGAHLREKLVEAASKKFIVIVDESKLCNDLGPSFSIPVEILRYSHEYITKKIEALPSLAGCTAKLRLGSLGNNKVDGDKPAVTDNGNYIVDLHFTKPIADVKAAAKELAQTVGVVEHGFFVDMATEVIVAGEGGIFVESRVEPKHVDTKTRSWISKL